MIHNNIYITELNVDGEQWGGPRIMAKSFQEADEYIENNGMGYLNVIGKLGFSFEIYELN